MQASGINSLGQGINSMFCTYNLHIINKFCTYNKYIIFQCKKFFFDEIGASALLLHFVISGNYTREMTLFHRKA